MCLFLRNYLNHLPHIESAIHEMKIESTAVEMFWKENNAVLCALIANICPEKKKNSLKLKKQLRGEVFQLWALSFHDINV